MEELTTTTDSVSAEPDIAMENAPTENQPDNAARGSRDFSPEERAKIIAMAKELGTSKVSRESGIKARLISYWIHQEKKASKPAKHQKAKTSKRTTERVKGSAVSEHITENAPAVLTAPVEPVKADKPLKKIPERKAEKAVPAKPSERSGENQALVVENAILKERISALNAEIEKLRSALTSLM